MSESPLTPGNKSLLKSALMELESMQAKLRRAENARTEPIAVIGLSCRFPGAPSPEAYWSLLEEGRSGVREIPAERFAIDDYYDPDPEAPGKIYTRFGAFLDGVADFDPQFFGISAAEAACLDPQQRLLLEVSWEALERAHLAPENLFGSNTGVFIGSSSFEYASRLGSSVPTESVTAYFGTGGALSATAGRLSYFYGFSGPSFTVDTACSSSLVALHQAVASLRNRETDLALSGGVNLVISPPVYITFCRAHMLAADGRCKTFDAAADGFVRGEGCGVLVLKRLSDALATGDRILALVRGSAVNQDGASGGFTVPSGPSQQAVIRRALANSGLQPSAIDYVEAHGTGTSLGDPIEISALRSVFGKERSSGAPLLVGSVKTNFGHLEGAAGIAGIVKVILSLQHEKIPPHLNYSRPNPYIPWDQLPLRVTAGGAPWRRSGRSRLAGVSSFGFTGTNAHVVLEEAPSAPALAASSQDRSLHLLTVSAKSQQALFDQALRFAEKLEAEPAPRAADFCYSANCGRSHFPFRWGVTGVSPKDLARQLRSRTSVARIPNAPGRLAFFFPAVLSPGGSSLSAASPVFHAAWQRCEQVRQGPIPFDSSREARFALQLALCELWKSFGLRPAGFLGEGIGNDAARTAAGSYSLEEGWGQAMSGDGNTGPGPAPASFSTILVMGTGAPSPAADAARVIQGGCAWESVLEALAELYEAGFTIDWESYDLPYSRNWIDLPGYPFQRQRHWVDLALAPALPAPHPLLGAREHLAQGHRWESKISPQQPAYLDEHGVYGQPVVPGAAFLEMALSAAAEVLHGGCQSVEGVRFHQALILRGTETRRLRLSVDRVSSAIAGFEISSAAEGSEDWSLHSSGKVVSGPAAAPSRPEFPEIAGTPLDAAVFYRQNSARNLQYGAAFQGIEALWGAQGEAWGRVRIPAGLRSSRSVYRIHPALLDACFQVLGASVPETALADPEVAFLPVSLSRLVLHANPPECLLVHVNTRQSGQDGLTADFKIFDEAKILVGEVSGLAFARVPRESLPFAGDEAFENLFYELQWRPKPLTDRNAAALPPPEQLAKNVEAQFDRLAGEAGLDGFVQGLPQLNRLAAGYAWTVIQELDNGAFRLSQDLPHARRLAGRLREIALENTDRRGLDELIRAYPEIEAELRLVARCGSQLGQVLGGAVTPVEALFPNGDFSLANRVYEKSPGAQVMNQCIAEAAAQCQAAMTAGRKLRILEVGGGTGGTTAHLLPRLAAEQVAYVFTDLSPVFAAQAQKRFAGFPSFTGRVLDIEHDPATQGFAEPGSPDTGFDLAISANVLHATADLHSSLQNIARLMAPGGLLILLEETSPENWIDVTFGLTEGWWRFTDLNLRTGHPLLASDRWLAVLSESGFEQARAVTAGSHALLLARTPQRRETHSAQPWLILADRTGVGAALACLLEVRGDECEVSYQAEIPRRPEGWRGAVHLRSLDLPDGSAPDFDSCWPAGCGSALELAQQVWAIPCPIWLVTRRAFAAEGLAQSPLWGFGKVLALENPEMEAVRVDLDSSDPAAAAAVLLEEILSGDGEREVLLRGNERLARRLVRSSSVPLNLNLIRGDGLYLITGGLRGLGMRIAERMVDAGARHLALLGRTAPGESTLERIALLRARGASVLILQADVAQAASLSSALGQVAQATYPLRGVVHSAGTLHDAAIPGQSREHFREVFLAKVDGAWNLHRMTLGSPLDFFVLFSSMASFFGSPGQSNHAAANTFLDALAGVRRSLGLPGLSIGWGPWSAIGAAADRDVMERMEAMGVAGLDPATGCRAFAALLQHGSHCVAVASVDWTRLLSRLPAGAPLAFFSEIDLPGGSSGHGRAFSALDDRLGHLSRLPVEERERHLHDTVRVLLTQTLGFPPNQIDMNQSLVDAGLDSLLALQLKSRAENELGIRIDLVKLVGGLSGADLAAMAAGRVTAGTAAGATFTRPDTGTGSVVESLATLDDLSEDSVDSLLSSLLQEEGSL
jgi:microcystin synthetase protein McyD